MHSLVIKRITLIFFLFIFIVLFAISENKSFGKSSGVLNFSGLCTSANQWCHNIVFFLSHKKRLKKIYDYVSKYGGFTTSNQATSIEMNGNANAKRSPEIINLFATHTHTQIHDVTRIVSFTRQKRP